jgi:RNA polymerase sigma-70 factor (ECF subfamily)
MDGEIHQLLAEGRRDRAFEKAVELYGTKVFRLVLSMTANAARAEEVSQDALLKVWQALDSFDPRRSSIGTWIYRIARNTALTHLRSESYRRTLPLEVAVEPSHTPVDDDLRDLVALLPEDLREVVVLYYYQERSVDDVATMLELPAGTVKSHLFRARKMLAEKLQGETRR